MVARPADLPLCSVLIQQHGTLFDAARVLPRVAEVQGRGVALVAELGGEACVVRHYQRGGAVARVFGDRYGRVAGNRVLHELRASEAARARGVATPAVKCGAWYRYGMFRRFDIATSYIPHSRDLAHVLFDDQPVDSAAVTAAARLIRDLLHGGLVHSDLNLKNILVTAERAYVIDLDRCRVVERVSQRQADSMRNRFLRSLAKWERLTGKQVPSQVRGTLREAFLV